MSPPPVSAPWAGDVRPAARWDNEAESIPVPLPAGTAIAVAREAARGPAAAGDAARCAERGTRDMTPNIRRNERLETGGVRSRNRLAAAALRLSLLLAALAVSTLALPVTALAAGEGAPAKLYVGNQAVIVANTVTYWTTDNSGGLTRVDDATDDSNDWTVRYNPNTATLTLNEATITGSSDSSVSKGAGIYALCSSEKPVFLTIELIGTNTVTGSYGIYVEAQQGETVGTNASLLIQNSDDDGSLEVSGSSYGIYVKSGTGNASLTINDASVVASCCSSYGSYAGVCVHSGSDATSSPKLSLAVDGGSLTTSASKGNDGIQFYVGANGVTSETTSLSVTNNAIVDARNGGISASGVNVNPTVNIGSADSTGGIVFDGTEGTVYGDVTLQENLEIGEGETLTIGEDTSLTVPDGVTLTNNGTVTTTDGGSLTNQGTINNSGTLPDSIEGSQPPKITTASLPNGEVDTTYNQTLGATGSETITWSLASGSTMPAGLTLNSDGTITGTPTTAGQFTFIATATNSAGSDSKEYELTINAPQNIPVNGVTLNPTLLSLFTGGSETLTATVEPSNATNKNVTWSSDKPEVATVENGKVTAKAAGTATITVTTEDGEKTATCTVTVTDKTYIISADATALDFGNAYTGYTQPAAKTVTITNDGNQDVTVTLPTSTNYIITAGTGFTNGSAAIEPDGTATFTVQPKAGLAVGTYSENISISGTHDVNATISATFTVKQYSSGGGTPTKTPSQQAVDKIESAKDGSTVEIELSTGSTKLDKEVFEELAGRDVTLEISLSNGITWTVNGQDIPENADLTDLDMGVSLNTSTIPVNLINSVTGEAGTVQLTLKHDGPFGFKATLVAPMGKDVAGMYANLYRYDDDAEALDFEASGMVDEDGTVRLAFDHASSWLIALDARSHALPFADTGEDLWYSEAVRWAWRHGVMTGYADGSGSFGTNDSLTRAQMAAVLYNVAGKPDADMSGLPGDCDGGAWYATCVSWALETGVFNGYGDGSSFGPDDPLTREQAACVLMNAASVLGADVSARTDLSAFPDADEVSPWASDALSWAVAEGVLSGVETADGARELQPTRACTRAAMAALMMNLSARSAE